MKLLRRTPFRRDVSPGEIKRRSSLSSTLTLDTSESVHQGPSGAFGTPLVVRFDETANIVHEHPTKTGQESASAFEICLTTMMWYSQEELHSFRKEHKAKVGAVRMVRKIAGGPNSNAAWIQYLAGAYERTCKQASRFHVVANAEREILNMNRVFCQGAPKIIPAELIGIEKWCVSGRLLKDRTQKRKEIWKQIEETQKSKPAKNPFVQGQEISQISMTLSQPNRVYAHYIAVLSAKTE